MLLTDSIFRQFFVFFGGGVSLIYFWVSLNSKTTPSVQISLKLSERFLEKQVVFIIKKVTTSSGEYVSGKNGRILIFEKGTWQMMRYYTLETAVSNHLQLEYTYNTVNQ